MTIIDDIKFILYCTKPTGFTEEQALEKIKKLLGKQNVSTSNIKINRPQRSSS